MSLLPCLLLFSIISVILVFTDICRLVVPQGYSFFAQQQQKNGFRKTVYGDKHHTDRSLSPPEEESLKKSNELFSYLAGAVVIAFVVCWLPYHIRRLMFCYVPSSHWTEWVATRGTSSPRARMGLGGSAWSWGNHQTWGWKQECGSKYVLHARVESLSLLIVGLVFSFGFLTVFASQIKP